MMAGRAGAAAVESGPLLLDARWAETVSIGGVNIRHGEIEGGVRINRRGEFEWYYKEGDTEVTPVEIVEELGPFEKRFNALRARKFNGIHQITGFGAISGLLPAGPCSFREGNPEDPASIDRRPYIALPNGLALLANGFPYTRRGHFLLLECDFDVDGKIRYPHTDQTLSRNRLSRLLEVTGALESGWVAGYNSPSAGCSVPRHYHAHILKEDLAVKDAPRITVGNLFYPYGWPAGCVGIEKADVETIWGIVDRLQRQAIPFNIIICGGANTTFIFGAASRV